VAGLDFSTKISSAPAGGIGIRAWLACLECGKNRAGICGLPRLKIDMWAPLICAFSDLKRLSNEVQESAGSQPAPATYGSLTILPGGREG
jgi:hypothetical protein